MSIALQRKKAYLNKEGSDCLFCGSSNIKQGFFESYENGASCSVSCLECNGIWSDSYILDDVAEIMHGDNTDDSV